MYYNVLFNKYKNYANSTEPCNIASAICFFYRFLICMDSASLTTRLPSWNVKFQDGLFYRLRSFIILA